MSSRETRMVWMDLEMTGLDPERCVIVEIATLVTEQDLTVVAEGPNLVIHQPEHELQKMDDVVRTMHERNGLLERIRESTVTPEAAESATREFIEAHVEPGKAPLCGNSIWKDRSFLERHMPSLVGVLHYRMIDVSTIKELVRRWYPDRYHAPKKRETHRALDDIRESIAELSHYRANVLVTP